MRLLKFEKFLIIGCTHGAFVDWNAFNAVLKFKKLWKPKIRIHLGDVIDLAAFRAGAKGTRDEASLLAPDLTNGNQIIRQFQPTLVLLGNHEDRVWNLSGHYNQMVARAAASCVTEFKAACEAVGAKLLEHYDINRSWFQLADDLKVLHGFGRGGENALRDTAEHFGRSIFAHFHRAEAVGGRRSDRPVGWCVGNLLQLERAEYAKTLRTTARWSHGFVYGETNGRESRVWLSQCPQGEGKRWPLPR